MMYRRAYQNLLLMQKSPIPNEPKPPFISNISNDPPSEPPPIAPATSNPPAAPPNATPSVTGADVGQTIAYCGLSTPARAPNPQTEVILALQSPPPDPHAPTPHLQPPEQPPS